MMRLREEMIPKIKQFFRQPWQIGGGRPDWQAFLLRNRIWRNTSSHNERRCVPRWS